MGVPAEISRGNYMGEGKDFRGFKCACADCREARDGPPHAAVALPGQRGHKMRKKKRGRLIAILVHVLPR